MVLQTITASQAWSILVRHARETHDLRLDSLCSDADRVAALVEAYTASNDSTIILDLSRQRMTEATVNHLLGLARSRQLYDFIQQLAWGQNDPKSPMHNNKKSQSVSSILHPQLAHFKESKLATAALANANKLPQKLDTSAEMDAETIMAQQQQQQSTSTTRPQHMHMAMRVPHGNNHVLLDHNGNNVLTDIHKEWNRIEQFSEAVRLGTFVSSDHQLFRDVLVVGKGTAVAALEFVNHALQCDERAVLSSKLGLSSSATDFMTLPRIRSHLTGTPWPTTSAATITPRQMHFLKSVDPITIAKVTSTLDPGRTMVISIAIQGNEDTGVVTKLLKQWLLDFYQNHKKSSASPDHVLSKHMILVTANQRIASVINKPESVYVIPSHSRCEPLINFTAATLLPLAVVYGWNIVQDFLDGAHDMDRHFVEKPPRHNLPILLALTDIWNDVLLESSSQASRIVKPFAEALTYFPRFVAALESQMGSKTLSSVSNGRPLGRNSTSLSSNKSSLSSMHFGCSSVVIDGGSEGLYDRSLLQSENTLINSELITIMDSQVPFHMSRSTMSSSGIVSEAQDVQMCAFFAHADELAFGGTKAERNNPQSPPWTSTTAASVTSKTNFSHFQLLGDSDWYEGNRPSTLLICGKLDAFTCGQLIAMSEHRATVKAQLWGIDPFVREVGSELCHERTEELQAELAKMFAESLTMADGEEKTEEDDVPLSLSTKTILRHYAKLYEDRDK